MSNTGRPPIKQGQRCDTQVSAFVPAELKRDIEDLAETKGITKSALMRDALEAAVKQGLSQ